MLNGFQILEQAFKGTKGILQQTIIYMVKPAFQ